MRIFHFVLILILLTFSCQSPKRSLEPIDIELVKSKVWNLDISDFKKSAQMSNQKYNLYTSKFKHIPVFFNEGSMHVESIDGSYDSCFFHNDTLMITETYNISGLTSTRYVIDTLFLGKIISISSDTLKIARIKDNIFNLLLNVPSKYRTLRFYNDSLLTKNPTEFKFISLSTGSCQGTCPLQAIELEKNGNMFYLGGTYAHKQGYYKGQLNPSSVDSIRHLLTAALINQDVFKLYGVPDDAPGCEVKIVLANNDTITIDGTPSKFNYRLWQIYTLLNKNVRSNNLIEDSNPHNFLSTKYIMNSNTKTNPAL